MTGQRDLTNQRFGRLTVISKAPSVQQRTHWNCRCDCGVIKEIRADRLANGDTTSCGCFRSEASTLRITEQNTTHGLRDHPSYLAWREMMSRCYNPNTESYKNYGGRGITVCERWHIVENFIADVGIKPEGMSLDRREVNGNYEPNNVRWASFEEQQNNKRNNHHITYNNERMTVSQAARKANIPINTAFSRIYRGNTDDIFSS